MRHIMVLNAKAVENTIATSLASFTPGQGRPG
jgi:hypothetical protein